MSLIAAMSEHVPASTAGAAITSGLATLGVTTQIIPLPEGTPPLLALALTILGPVVTLVISRLLAAYAAKLRTRAAAKEKKALAVLADADAKNDQEGNSLLDEAAEDRANADALEALKPRR
jgi:hypothetical protein